MEENWLSSIIGNYPIKADKLEIRRFGSGHIHKTYLINTGKERYILQEFNDAVFRYPERISANQQVILADLDKDQLPFALPLPIKNKENSFFTKSQSGLFRLFPFIEGTTRDAISLKSQAKTAAEAFAYFIRGFVHTDAGLLQDSIPDFHNLDLRFRQFEESLKNPQPTIDGELEELIAFYLAQRNLVDQYLVYVEALPTRVTHNDTKINNLIFRDDLRKVNALIDLDTIMSGYVFYDFGDLVRTVACTEDESSQNWDKIAVDPEKYEGLLEGFYHTLNGVIKEEEMDSLPFGGEMMTCIMGLRFLTDYLNGNIYYQISYPEQNLHRSKNQSFLLKSLISYRPHIQKMQSHSH
ncbi:phosphotransferase enzyme family protein [Negadavirga shengliensis]|uniref:Phosphotransferase enzyme family protein n=1 Tax=Negadavirga shengliensis TaxID=1389218 RepID=A0ABV9SVX3_9BACT